MSEKSKFPMTAVAEAIAKVVEEAGRLPTRWEEISITTAHGRVLATDVIAKAPFPLFRGFNALVLVVMAVLQITALYS